MKLVISFFECIKVSSLKSQLNAAGNSREFPLLEPVRISVAARYCRILKSFKVLGGVKASASSIAAFVSVRACSGVA